jgi:hypothetical protein
VEDRDLVAAEAGVVTGHVVDVNGCGRSVVLVADLERLVVGHVYVQAVR